MMHVCQTLKQRNKEVLSRLSAVYSGQLISLKGMKPHGGPLFNTSTGDGVKIEKWPIVELYLDELPG